MGLFKTSLFCSAFVVLVVGCSKNSDSKRNSSKYNGPSDSAVNWASKQPLAVSLPYILEPCSDSKRYQSKDWEGTNSCSWALEKEIISKLPEYVKRTDDILEFQTDNKGWRALKAEKSMVNHYIPEFHVFILKFFTNENCEEYGIYDPKQDHLERLKGQFFLSADNKFFAVVPKSNCGEKAKIARFNKGKGLIIKEIDEKSPISGIKWGLDNYAIVLKSGDSEKFVYRKLP